MNPKMRTVELRSLFCLCSFFGVVPHLCAGAQRAVRDKVQLANVAPRPIRLPIVDATDNRFVRLSTAQGLSQIKVDRIVQDDQGFMWFGTRFGLYRYDGYTFKVFVNEPGDPNSLGGVSVNALFKDHDGALWIGCDQSLNKFDRTTETFKSYPIPFANHIAQDAAGTLWITSRSGLYSLDPASGRIQHYSSDPNNPSGFASNDLSYCGEDKRGVFWVADSGYLDEFDRRAGKVTRHILVPDALDGFNFYEDRFGVFWIYHSSPNPLAVFDRETQTLTNYAFPEREPTVMRVSAMTEDRNGALWIATHGLGLLKLDREHDRFTFYTNRPEDPESFPQNKVDALFTDRVGNIWAAPGRMAPAFFPTKPPPFKRLPRTPGSTIEPYVGALYEDRRGVLWMGTPEALNRVDRNNGRITAYRTGGSAIGADVVSIAEDRSGNLWVGTYGHGLHRFDRKTGKFKTYCHNPADPYSLSNDVVTGLLVDHNGTLWAATGDGLNRFDRMAERFTTYKLDPQRTVFGLTMTEDQQGKLWIGTVSSGLRRFDPATAQIVVYEHNRSRAGTLSDNRVNSVHFDRSGAMWVGTQNGLDRLDPQTGQFKAFRQREGLPGNTVGCILEDKNGNLWMSTNNGAEICDLTEIIDAASEAAVAATENQRVQILLDVPGEIEIPLARSRLKLMFFNLITNALEAMPGGGEVRIAARRSRDYVLVTIEDTGPGIPHQIRDKVFEPFVTAGKKNGLGLGLAFCRQSVLDHGGDIWTEPAAGARFVIRLPLNCEYSAGCE